MSKDNDKIMDEIYDIMKNTPTEEKMDDIISSMHSMMTEQKERIMNDRAAEELRKAEEAKKKEEDLKHKADVKMAMEAEEVAVKIREFMQKYYGHVLDEETINVWDGDLLVEMCEMLTNVHSYIRKFSFLH